VPRLQRVHYPNCPGPCNADCALFCRHCVAAVEPCIFSKTLMRCPCRLQIEELKLLSTAEKLGLLALAERALTSDPGAVSSLSILPFLGAVGALPLPRQGPAP